MQRPKLPKRMCDTTHQATKTEKTATETIMSKPISHTLSMLRGGDFNHRAGELLAATWCGRTTAGAKC